MKLYMTPGVLENFCVYLDRYKKIIIQNKWVNTCDISQTVTEKQTLLIPLWNSQSPLSLWPNDTNLLQFHDMTHLQTFTHVA